MTIMKRLAFGLLGLVVGYPIGAFAGYWLVEFLSSNTFDRGVEAAMTSAFVYGPLGACAGLIVGIIRGGRVSGPKSEA